jgi:hypothetical protein
MTRRIFSILLCIGGMMNGYSQNIGIGTLNPDPSAQLDISASNRGLLIPRLSSSAIAAIVRPARGLLLYDSTINQLKVNMGTPLAPGWQNIIAGSSWQLSGNGGIDTAIHFIGTTDAQPLWFRINGRPAGMIEYDTLNGNGEAATYLGYGAGKLILGRGTSAASLANAAFGYAALDSNLSRSTNNPIGIYNTVFGAQAMSRTSQDLFAGYVSAGSYNTAVGYQAMYHPNFSNDDNTGIGYQALFNGGTSSIATGWQCMYKWGFENTATGAQALFSPQVASKSSGRGNTAFGNRALYNNSGTFDNSANQSGGGGNNTATGYSALFSNVAGNYNSAGGYQALYKNYYGEFNTAYGSGALYQNSVHASQNTAVGFNSLVNTINSEGNTAIGYNAGSRFDNGYYNCFIGSETDANGPQYYNTIAIGHGTIVTAPNMMRVGNTATTSIGGPVGWSVISDGRVKKNIRENVPGLSFINKLRPISYNIDPASIDRLLQTSINANDKVAAQTNSARMREALKTKEQIVYTGFAAQEVEQAAQSIGFSFSGVDAARNNKDIYSLRYADFVAPLVKSVQELALRQEQLKKEQALLLKQKEQALLLLSELEKKMH